MKRILIVDDDKLIARTLQIRLVHAGYEVMAVYDGTMAVGQALKIHPDLMILDVSMPTIDGFWVAETVHSLPDTADIPIIFMTAYSKTAVEHRARCLDAFAYIEKPYEVEDLLETVKAALNCPPSRLHA